LQKGENGKADEIVKKLDIASMDSERSLEPGKVLPGRRQRCPGLPFFKQALKRYPDSAEVNYQLRSVSV